MNKPILDTCCGSRMFWFNKENPNVLFCDNRILEEIIYHNRKCEVKPDIQCDVTNLPFADCTFKLVVFDPPHFKKLGETSWMFKKYGKLPHDWKDFIKKGFSECMRVLDYYGVLIFKWSEVDIPTSEIIKTIGVDPLIGHKSGRLNKTHWMCFMKLKEESV